MRLVQRDITIDNFISDKINSIVDKEKLKGSKDILIMSDETAYIVNVPNKTMITVMSKEELKENIFTNIDAVAIIQPDYLQKLRLNLNDYNRNGMEN